MRNVFFFLIMINSFTFNQKLSNKCVIINQNESPVTGILQLLLFSSVLGNGIELNVNLLA